MKMKHTPSTPLRLMALLSLLPTLTVCQNITVDNNGKTDVSITPTYGGLVQLFCGWSKHRGKAWYTTNSATIKNTPGVIFTDSGQTRTLAFLNFNASYAGTYSCVLSAMAHPYEEPVTYMVTLVNTRNTVKVGMNSKTILTVRPDESEPVKLECERTSKDRNWYSGGSTVTPTSGQLNTTDLTGVATLSISTLNANNTGYYTCKVTDGGTTEYTIVLGVSPTQVITTSEPFNPTIPIIVVLLIIVIIVLIVIVILGIVLYLKRNDRLPRFNRSRSTKKSLIKSNAVQSSPSPEVVPYAQTTGTEVTSSKRGKADVHMYDEVRDKENATADIGMYDEIGDKGNGASKAAPPPMAVEFHAEKKEEVTIHEYRMIDKSKKTSKGANGAIATEQFLQHIKKHSEKNFSGFHKEFETIPTEPDGVASIAKANKHKNRYKNIYTFDHSRVALSVPDRNGSDYINASYIDGYKARSCYIATQGPTPDTVSDFLQLVWDSKTPIIVMLTQPEEKGKRKCEQYWNNNLSETFQAGSNMTVVVNQCLGFADYEVRDMTILNTTDGVSKSHNLQHFLYTGWPDHGVPQHPYSLVKLSQQVRKKYKKNSAPMVVHCSAGVGRTGTFITIDAMIQRLKERDDLNIYEFVTEMRSKRTFMVQTKEQYIFIHDALNDYVTCGTTCVAAHELKRLISRQEEVTEDGRRTGFDKQFEVLQSICKTTSSDDKTNARKSSVSKKNRYSDRYPYYTKHLIVSGKTRESGQGYINASQVQSYSNPRAFIAAQAPLKNTREDFWDVVWNFKPPTIVLLCDFVEGSQNTCSPFFPTEEYETEVYGSIKITKKSAKRLDGYMKFTLELSSSNKSDSKPFEVTLFHTGEWKVDNRPKLSSLLNIMAEVQIIQQGQTKRCLVACDDGMGRTGVFITVMSEIERIKFDGEIDIFQTIKAIRVQRPNMVSTGVQYKLCFEFIQEYLQSFDNYANFKPV